MVRGREGKESSTVVSMNYFVTLLVVVAVISSVILAERLAVAVAAVGAAITVAAALNRAHYTLCLSGRERETRCCCYALSLSVFLVLSLKVFQPQ